MQGQVIFGVTARARALAPASILAAAQLLAGCSSDQSRLYDIFKCGKAASLLGDAKAARSAGRKAAAYDSKVQGSKGALAMELNARFEDDYSLSQRSPGDAVRILRDLYSSSTCQSIYEP